MEMNRINAINHVTRVEKIEKSKGMITNHSFFVHNTKKSKHPFVFTTDMI